MSTECKFCAGTGNLGGGEKDKTCPKCDGTGKILEAGESAPAPAPEPTASARTRGRSRPN